MAKQPATQGVPSSTDSPVTVNTIVECLEDDRLLVRTSAFTVNAELWPYNRAAAPGACTLSRQSVQGITAMRSDALSWCRSTRSGALLASDSKADGLVGRDGLSSGSAPFINPFRKLGEMLESQTWPLALFKPYHAAIPQLPAPFLWANHKAGRSSTPAVVIPLFMGFGGTEALYIQRVSSPCTSSRKYPALKSYKHSARANKGRGDLEAA